MSINRAQGIRRAFRLMSSNRIPPPPPEPSHMMPMRAAIGIGGFSAILWLISLPENDRADILPGLYAPPQEIEAGSDRNAIKPTSEPKI